ncbi:alpha-amylase family glycosyl hydrolase [Nocardioides mesophilus]|uniref:alpha-amylase family glycosyl hydrolase n=1 Tax=Nocardioides mesophilus TaxID=433659 RepID=UPI001CB6FCC9|nr:alpha-amylase family glycosyl hydrolase [Nocardioides mesophilus]
MHRSLIAATLAALASGLVATAAPALADHTAAPPPDSVALVGDLQTELGCPTDWAPECAATELTLADGAWTGTFTVPAGAWEYKVALNDAWTENYGDGQDNLKLNLLHDARLVFRYDPHSHAVSVAPAAAPKPVNRADKALAQDSLREALTRERLYFVMADRFANGDKSNDTAGLGKDRLVSGYDPTATGFYHGGDLAGVIDRLDYIQGLGTTAIWLTPSFKNKPVQGAPGSESAGYHGYWITDFTKIDPHLGSNRDMARLVKLAHKRGLKVFFDIITNHTADVIGYDRSQYDASGNLPYVSTEDEPYRDAEGNPFDDRDYADGSKPFPEVNLDSFPYKPVVPQAEQDEKVPAWLNDPRYYHNRGTSTFSGESNTYGDFPSGPYSALDDLWTEHPRVVRGMEDIYKTWVRQVGIDGFRIDTVKHNNMEFWQQFSPALTDYAAEQGNKDFFMFGEVYDASSKFVSQYTTEGRLQAAVDFGFQANATGFAKGGATDALRDFYAEDDWYTDADSNAYQLPTFLGNHDMGRIGSFLRQNTDGWSERQLLRRDELAHSLMYLTRGQPVVYYGDEQGFSAPADVPGGIGDQRAREDMFPSKVDLYNGYDLIGSDDTTAQSNFHPNRPLYKHIARLARVRAAHPVLADGAQVHRYSTDGPGIYAFSRVDPQKRREFVVAVNNSGSTARATFDTFSPQTRFGRVWASPWGGSPRARHTDRSGQVTLRVPAYGAVVYRADKRIPDDGAAPVVTLDSLENGGIVGGRAEIGASVASDSFTQVSFGWRPVGEKGWRPLGTDDNAPFRVFHDVRDLPFGTLVEYRAVVRDADGDLAVDQRYGVVGEPPKQDTTPDWGGPVTQPTSVSVPGMFNSEVGCTEDWQPTCAAIQLGLDEEDGVWSKTFTDQQTIPQGGHGYKVAVDSLVHPNDPWAENYGAGGVPNGDNITLDADGGPITFWYSHATHWVTNSIDTPHLYVAAGDFQSELGCGADDDPTCLRSWLQDPDGDGVWTLRSHTLPAGTYHFVVTQDQTTDGSWGQGGAPSGTPVSFTLADGQGVEISFTPPAGSDPGQAAAALTVQTYTAPTP